MKSIYFLLTAAILMLIPACSSTPEEISLISAPLPVAMPVQAEEESPAISEPAQVTGLDLTIANAVLIGLENNRDLNLKRLDLKISTLEQGNAAAEFNTALTGSISSERETGLSAGTEYTADSLISEAAMEKKFTTGTELAVSINSSQTDNSLNASPETELRIGVSVTQALLQGRSISANRAAISQARIDSQISAHELHGYTMFLTAAIEKSCWDYALALDKISIFEDSLKLADKQLYATTEKIAAGRLPKIDMAAAQAEVALRQEDLITAKSSAEQIRLKLLRLLNPNGSINWAQAITITDQPTVPAIEFESIEKHAELALKLRPDLNQAKLQVKYNDLEVVRTRNGLLPKLDLFIRLGQTGYADSFDAATKDFTNNHYDAAVGLSFAYPSVSGTSPSTLHDKAWATRQQARTSLKNMKDLAQYDLRTAYVKANQAKEQVTATTATRTVQEEKLRAELEKFGVGRSNTLQVAQAQRDSVESRIAEKEAVVSFLKALINLYMADGSLLVRRGIATPEAK